VLTNITSESSHCFWKGTRNWGCRFCIIVCPSFWEDSYMLISKSWNRITKSIIESAKCIWWDRVWNHRQFLEWKVQKIPILSMGPAICSLTFVCTLPKERQIFKSLISTTHWDSHHKPHINKRHQCYVRGVFRLLYSNFFIEPLETYVFLLYPNITNCLTPGLCLEKRRAYLQWCQSHPPLVGLEKLGLSSI
jgi:hypothetical protein